MSRPIACPICCGRRCKTARPCTGATVPAVAIVVPLPARVLHNEMEGLESRPKAGEIQDMVGSGEIENETLAVSPAAIEARRKEPRA